MENTASIYQDMAARTGGSVYIGVVGPVRTGKSTFVKRFMETQVLPHIDNMYRRDRAQDELPQSGSGRTIMTAEPKFVPEEAVEIQLAEGVRFSVRLVDCVGYMVDSAVGQFEDLAPRMVMTPWFDHEIPMTEAAEIGTRKVITDHATVGVVVTADGTVTDIPREDYQPAEERVIRELQAIGKPFIVSADIYHAVFAESLLFVCFFGKSGHKSAIFIALCKFFKFILNIFKQAVYKPAPVSKHRLMCGKVAL